MDKLLTVRDVADRLGVTPLVVRRWITTGDLPATRIGGQTRGRFRITESGLKTYMRRRRAYNGAHEPPADARIIPGTPESQRSA